MPVYLVYICAAALLIGIAALLFFFLRARRNKTNNGMPSDEPRFVKLILHEHSCTAEENEYELVRTEKGVRISNFFGNWWDAGEGVHSRKNCLAKRRGGSMELYDELVGKLSDIGVMDWDGFDETDPDVCDGGGFWLEIELEDGRIITASGMNAYPKGYNELISILRGLFEKKE